MTFQLLLSAAFSLLGVAYYLLRRFWIENQRLASNEKLARECMRDAIWSRDALVVERDDLRWRCAGLEEELAEFRKEDVRRVVQERGWS